MLLSNLIVWEVLFLSCFRFLALYNIVVVELLEMGVYMGRVRG